MIKTVILFVWGVGVGGVVLSVRKCTSQLIHDKALSKLQGSELASSLVMLL